MTSSYDEVCFGSLADIRARNRDVRFTPRSGHALRPHQCLLSANSGSSSQAASGIILVKSSTTVKLC